MKRINFIFGVHNHQPVGNFPQVFEDLYNLSYGPFLRVLQRHPSVKCAFHITGPLLEWLEANRKEYLATLKGMVKTGQVEFFTGGIYEPILAVLPDRDKVGQIRALTAKLKELFGTDAVGMWAAERVWEPHLTAPLARAGVRYLVMDDAHFKGAGLTEQQTFGWYLMEEQGETVGVFPISERMRYLVPFRQVHETLDYLHQAADEEGNRCVVLMDDGEKFGGWPDTYKWVYEEGWLENFFKALEENASWIRLCTFREFADSVPPLGPLNLPTGSYTEMGEWSLPAEAAEEYGRIRHEVSDKGEMPRFERYLKGGFWRNFLVKYEEVNHLHKKMLYVSNKVEEARRKLGAKPPAAKRKVLEAAERALYRGQCNCPYWHGVFGGLYLNHLRFAVYRELIEAEKLAESLLPTPKGGLAVKVLDFDKDGRDEILLESSGYHAVLAPSEGGVLTELDWLEKPINLTDTLTRRKEAYHSKLLALAGRDGGASGVASIHDQVRVKEAGLEGKLTYDPTRRVSLTERFVPRETTVGAMRAVTAEELGDFRTKPFEWKATGPKGKDGSARIHLEHLGRVKGKPLGLVKDLRFQAGELKLEAAYGLENPGSTPLEFLFFVEWNLTLLAGDAPDRNYFIQGRDLSDARLNSEGAEEGVQEAGLRDDWLGLEIHFRADRPVKFWRYPVETVSRSEGGFEKVYQGSCLLFGWEVSLAPHGSFRASLGTELRKWKP